MICNLLIFLIDKTLDSTQSLINCKHIVTMQREPKTSYIAMLPHYAQNVYLSIYVHTHIYYIYIYIYIYIYTSRMPAYNIELNDNYLHYSF